MRSERGLAAKGVLAAVFMVGALGFLGWRVGARLGDGEKKKPVMKGQAVTPEGEAIEANYTPVRSQSAAREAGRSVTERIGSLTGSLAPATIGQGVSDALPTAAGGLVTPILAGDFEAFVEMLRSMGAEFDEESDRGRRLFDDLAGWFERGEPDLDRVEVRAFEMGGGRGGDAPARVVSRAEATSEDARRAERGTGVRKMAMSTEGLFPGAKVMGDGAARNPIEVTVPMRITRGAQRGGEATLGIVLVWNAGAGAWQPGMFSKTIVTVGEQEGP